MGAVLFFFWDGFSETSTTGTVLPDMAAVPERDFFSAVESRKPFAALPARTYFSAVEER